MLRETEIHTYARQMLETHGPQAIAKAVEQIASGMKSVPWSALVIDTNHAQVFVNAGSERNVQVGMQLNLYRKGAVLTDPATGIVLDVEMEKIGVVQIMEVREKISIAAVVIGEKPTRGNILRPICP